MKIDERMNNSFPQIWTETSHIMLQLTCVIKGQVFAFYLGSGVEGFKASLTEYKREEGRSCRKLTANEGGGVVKMLQSLMGDHVHSPCHNQIPSTSLSDKKRQKEKKKRARPGEKI